MAEAIGGFWAQLELKTKEKSFQDGMKRLDNVKKSVVSFASAAIKAFSISGSGLLALVGVTASYEARNMMLASSLRMSSSEMLTWKGAANIMGVSAEGLTGALLDLQKKSDRIKLGEVDVGLAKSLGMLGVGYQSFLKQDTSSKMKTVFEKAMNMTDKGKAGELIRDVLGDSGKEMFQYMEMTGQSLDSILGKSKALMFTNDNTRKQAMMFNQEFKATFGSFKEMGSLFFSTFGGAMTPVLRNLQQLIIKNKGLISTGIVKFAKELAKIGSEVFKVLSVGIPFVVKLVDKLGGLDKIIGLVVKGFLAFQAFKMISGIAGIVSALTGLSAGPVGLVVLGFVALALVLNDIYEYMDKGDKIDSVTGRFIKWLDDIGEKTKWVKDLSEALHTLLHPEDVDFNKLNKFNQALEPSAEYMHKEIKKNPFWGTFIAPANLAAGAIDYQQLGGMEYLKKYTEKFGTEKYGLYENIMALNYGLRRGHEAEDIAKKENELTIYMEQHGVKKEAIMKIKSEADMKVEKMDRK
jgi:hypothetical protein